MTRLYSRVTTLAVSGCLLFLLAACGPFGSAPSGSTPPASTGGATATPTTGHAPSTPTTGGAIPKPTTVPMPPTQTTCPSGGGARAAVFAPLVAGSHQNIVYIFNQLTSSGNYAGEIKRYDASTGQKFIIVNVPGRILGAQISPDGQWVLFTTPVGLAGGMALQLVRMDGQGLQTLYCSTINSIEWSPDQKTVMFKVPDQVGGGQLDLLDLATGHLQVELVEPTTGGNIGYTPATWLDDTHLYMTSYISDSDAPPQSLYVLDTTKGANQQVGDLIKAFNYSGYGMSFDSSVDNSTLFVSTCHANFGDGPNHFQQGPSSLISEPALGGPPTTVYTNPTLAITTVRVISRTTMLLLIQNLTGDTNQNGLWKMNLDGTGLTRLTAAGTGQMISLNGLSQFPWSNVSRDGSMYVLEGDSNQGTTHTQALLIGSLGGNGASTFATVSGTAGENVALMGWITM